MTEQPSISFYAKFSLAIAALLVVPAIWSLCSAIYAAATTGQVLVISIGRYETARELVPWPNGWARFAAPVIMVASLGVWGNARKGTQAWWVAAALSTLSLILLLFSKWFTSWGGALWFAGLMAFIAVTLYVGNKYGRWVAYIVVAAAFGFILWRAAIAA